MFGIADYGAFVAAIIMFLAIPGPGQSGADHLDRQGRHPRRPGRHVGRHRRRPGADVGWRWPAWRRCWPPTRPPSMPCSGWAPPTWPGSGFRMLLAKPGAAPILHIRPRHYFRQALADHLAQPEGDRVLHGVLPAVRRPGAAQGLVTFGVMALTIAALTFLYGLTATLLTHFLAERLRANPAHRPRARKAGGRVPDRLRRQAGGVQQ